jgi:hypothetical protein
MFASQAQAVVQSAGTPWLLIVLFALAIVVFWRLAVRIILVVLVVMILSGVLALASFMHSM